MRKPLLIASDVDGTLVESGSEVSPRTLRVVNRARAEGIPVVLVSGRAPRLLQPVAESLGIKGYAVCANGAAIFDLDNQQVIESATLEPNALAQIAETLLEAIPGCSFAVERISEHTSYFAGQSEGFFFTEKEYRHAWPLPIPTQATRADLLALPAVKLMVRHLGMTSEDMAYIANSVLDSSVTTTYSTSVGLLELSVPGVSKATGLATVAHMLGVSAQDVIAFGDMVNDLPMLSWAGYGVAMGNAHPELKAVASEVTASQAEDGVAQVLERWFGPTEITLPAQQNLTYRGADMATTMGQAACCS